MLETTCSLFKANLTKNIEFELVKFLRCLRSKPKHYFFFIQNQLTRLESQFAVTSSVFQELAGQVEQAKMKLIKASNFYDY